MIQISEDLAVKLVAALNQAIGLSSVKEPALRDGFLTVANELDDAINSSPEELDHDFENGASP